MYQWAVVGGREYPDVPMTAPLTLRLPELVQRVKKYFLPLEARVHFPGDYSRVDNVKVVDGLGIERARFDATTEPEVSAKIAEILFGVCQPIPIEISEPDPDPEEEDAFYWELVERFEIPPEVEVEEWLSIPEGRRAWGEWTTWHDHTRIATLWPPPA